MRRPPRQPFPMPAAAMILLALAGLAGCDADGGSDGGAGSDAGLDAVDGGEAIDAAAIDAAARDGAPRDDASAATDAGGEPAEPDANGDGTLDILVLGTSRSIRQAGGAFSATGIAAELGRILSADASLGLSVNVIAADIHQTERVEVGLGQGGTVSEYEMQSHSLAQYYYWPSGQASRLDELSGDGDVDWDQVIIAADPEIIAQAPGYFALGVDKIAARVREGGGQARLMMVWPRGDAGESVGHFEEFTYRAADGARDPLPVVPAGLAWHALPPGLRDTSTEHPSPSGAYLAAATVYAELFGRSASSSEYSYDDDIADAAHAAVETASASAHYAGRPTFESPFSACGVTDRVLNYNHTGTSSENGILAGLRWVLTRARVQLVNGGDAPIDFNFGRANTNFEADKRYRVDPDQFDFSLGFPMQDNANTGDESMLYGLDHRGSEVENGTDLGVAMYMARNGELPFARALPIRTLFAQMREVDPAQSAYRDAWHMDRDLDRATGAFMYTLLTGHCALDEEPADRASAEWRSWTAHRIGYETAWSVMHLRSVAPGFRVLPDSEQSVSVTPTESAGLAISFANRPTRDVTVRLTTNNDAAVTLSPTELVFTPDNHATPQTVTMTGRDGASPEERYEVASTTSSQDANFDGFVDRWEYTVLRP